MAFTSSAPVAARTALFISDVQTRFRSLIHGSEALIACVLHLATIWAAFDAPVLVTEQYPKAFGSTVDEVAKAAFGSADPASLAASAAGRVAREEKTQFSMLTTAVLDWIAAKSIDSIVLCGLETHICVLQTARDALARGLRVYIVVEGVSSQRVFDRRVALERLGSMGARLTTCESLTFELLGDSKHPAFKAVLAKNNERSTAVSASADASVLCTL